MLILSVKILNMSRFKNVLEDRGCPWHKEMLSFHFHLYNTQLICQLSDIKLSLNILEFDMFVDSEKPSSYQPPVLARMSRQVPLLLLAHAVCIVTGACSSNQRESRFSRILKNYFEISLLDLDLEVFQFHFHFSKRVKEKIISLFISQKE